MTATSTAITVTRTANTYTQANPSQIAWPADKYGFTTALKAAFVKAATRVHGSADKKALFDSVVALGCTLMADKYNETLGS